jgi:hypothetical protein
LQLGFKQHALDQAAAVKKVGFCRPVNKIPQEMEKLAQFQWNRIGRHLSMTPLNVLALTLKDRYDLGMSDRRVRKALLRWTITNDCTGSVEHL